MDIQVSEGHEQLKRYFFWNGIKQDIIQYIMPVIFAKDVDQEGCHSQAFEFSASPSTSVDFYINGLCGTVSEILQLRYCFGGGGQVYKIWSFHRS